MGSKDVPGPEVASDPLAADSTPRTSADSKSSTRSDTDLASAANTDDRGIAVHAVANQVINAINLAAEAAESIDRIVRSISGIIEQAGSDGIPANRLSKLEAEANTLVIAIQDEIANAAGEHGNPLLGDPLQLELQQELGKTLDLVLPEYAKDSFGLGLIDLSCREHIVDLRDTVERAQQRLHEVKKAVHVSRKTIEATLAEVDVALQNAEASQVTVRELDQALQFLGRAADGIKSNPKSALDSIRRFRKQALELLE